MLRKKNYNKGKNNTSLLDTSYVLLDDAARKSVPFTELADPRNDAEL